MAHLHKKLKNGRPYYYVREIARVDGKPKVINQVYLGTPEKILEMATQGGTGGITKIQAQEFGALWLANQIEQEIGFAEIVDSVVSKEKNEKGPTVGEYFLYAVFNRMISARSKRAMPDWFKTTAIQHIRPVDCDALSSQNFWKKWDRVDEQQIEQIAKKFFARVAELTPASSDCFLFDTTNYYTFMASDTESDLAKRGKNKEGRDWLRQVGVALLVARDSRLPLFYREYEGNRHDSKVFAQVMDEVLIAMQTLSDKPGKLTLVFDKGMNAEENFATIDANERLGFITSYSPFFAEDLVQVNRTKFIPVDTDKNRRLREDDRIDDQITAWRTTGEYWGRERAVVVTYNPLTATKQRYNFEKKLLRLQETLFEMSVKVRRQMPHWRKQEEVEAHYADLCSELHLPADLYTVGFYQEEGRLNMSFRKNHYRIGRYVNRFGKNILITSNTGWTTDEIVRASLDRYMVENAFRQTKDDELVGMMPLRHWTDSKIRCHILTCVVALTYLRLVELRLKRGGIELTAQAAMEHMHRLHSCLVWQAKKKNAVRLIEEPDEQQAAILHAFGQKLMKGVLQEVST